MAAVQDIQFLPIDILSSGTRWLVGWGIGSIVAFLFNVIFYSRLSRSIRVSIIVDFLRSIPILAIVPLTLYYFGAWEYSKFFIIAWSSFFPVLVATRATLALPNADQDAFIAGFHLGFWRLLRIQILPKLLFGLVSGMRVAIGVAWISVIAAEMLGIYSTSTLNGGLGYRLYQFYDNGNLIGMLIYVLIFGLLGVLSAFAFQAAVSRVLAPVGYVGLTHAFR